MLPRYDEGNIQIMKNQVPKVECEFKNIRYLNFCDAEMARNC